MKYLIVGRVASGKTTFADILSNGDLSVAKSYTTRPRRPNETDGHFFISEEQAATIPDEDRVLPTCRNGYSYFMTREDIEDFDIFVVDPYGVRDIMDALPNEQFTLFNIRASNPAKAAQLHNERDPHGLPYTERAQAEDAVFSEFERNLDKPEYRSKYAKTYIIYTLP